MDAPADTTGSLLSEPELTVAQLPSDTRDKTGRNMKAPWQIYLSNVTSYTLVNRKPYLERYANHLPMFRMSLICKDGAMKDSSRPRSLMR